MFLMLAAAARTTGLFLGDGEAEDHTGTHPNDVFGGAYDFCRAKFGSPANVDKCQKLLTKGATHVCKGVEDRYGECHAPITAGPGATPAFPG